MTYNYSTWEGFPRFSLPKWLVKEPLWSMSDGRLHALTDNEWFILATLFTKTSFGFHYRKQRLQGYEVKFSQKDLVSATGIGKGHVSEAIASLLRLGIIAKLPKSHWSLAPAIQRGFENENYRDVLIPKEVLGLVPIKYAQAKEVRLWCAVHFYALVNKTGCVRVPQSALCKALGLKGKAVGRISTSAERKMLVNAERTTKQSTVYDPRPIAKVLIGCAGGPVRLPGAGLELTEADRRKLAKAGGVDMYDVTAIILAAIESNPPLEEETAQAI